MPFVELFAPKGSLEGQRRAYVTQRLAAEVMAAEGAPDSAAARAISWLVATEPDAWFVGGEAVSGEELPRYLVRVSVPGGSMDDAKRADMVERVTRVLADADASDDPQRLYREPVAWVHVVEIPDGNWGAFGQVVRLEDIVRYASGAVPAG